MTTLASAASEYLKDSRLHPEDIVQLQEWLKKQPQLPQQISEEFLITVLHSSDYSVQRAKQLIELNISCRTNYPEMFANRDPLTSNKLDVWNCLNFWMSESTTKDNYHVFYVGLRNFDPDLYDFPSVINVCFSVLDAWVGQKGVCPGYVVILNAYNYSFAHLAKSSITTIRNIINFVQEAICIKIKAIHVINVSPVVDKIMFIAKPFFKKELLDMLYFHNRENMDEFYNSLPKDLLPKELGGTRGSTSNLSELEKQRLKQMRDWLIDQEQLRIEDDKRTGNNKEDIYSVAGSFRKLEVD